MTRRDIDPHELAALFCDCARPVRHLSADDLDAPISGGGREASNVEIAVGIALLLAVCLFLSWCGSIR